MSTVVGARLSAGVSMSLVPTAANLMVDRACLHLAFPFSTPAACCCISPYNWVVWFLAPCLVIISTFGFLRNVYTWSYCHLFPMTLKWPWWTKTCPLFLALEKFLLFITLGHEILPLPTEGCVSIWLQLDKRKSVFYSAVTPGILATFKGRPCGLE